MDMRGERLSSSCCRIRDTNIKPVGGNEEGGDQQAQCAIVMLAEASYVGRSFFSTSLEGKGLIF